MRGRIGTCSNAKQIITYNTMFEDKFTRRQYEGKLFRAIAGKKFKLARILVDGGVNVNCALRTDVTPLMMACDHKVDGSLKRMRLDLVRALIEQKADMFAKDNFGRTPLMYAYISGDRQMMHMLAMNCDNGWIDAPIHDPRVRIDSVIVRSNICMHFQHWQTDDFAQYMNEVPKN